VQQSATLTSRSRPQQEPQKISALAPDPSRQNEGPREGLGSMWGTLVANSAEECGLAAPPALRVADDVISTALPLDQGQGQG